MLSIAGILRDNGYDINLFDCLDRNHSILNNLNKKIILKHKKNGTGNYFKEIIDKPDLLKWVPRKYGRYGIPLSLVRKELSNYSPPDIVLLTSGMTYWYPGVFEMIKLLRSIFPEVSIVLGGIYATLCYEHARRKSGADYVLSGEGEISALQIVDEISGNKSSWEQYRSIDDYPPIAYDLYTKLESAALLTSRGCPFNCPVCASNILSGKYRSRSVSKIIKEIKFLNKNFKVTEFAFYDDALLHKKNKHIRPLLNEIIKSNIKIHFHTPNGIQPREVDISTAILMKKSGFITIRLSYETIDRDRQKELSSKITDDDLKYAVINLKLAGFQLKKICAYVLMGLPGQDIEEVIKSILFVYGLGIKISLASFSPIPGTKYWDESVRMEKIYNDIDPVLTNNSIFPLNPDKFHEFVSLRSIVSFGNQIISTGKNPLDEKRFFTQLDQLLN